MTNRNIGENSCKGRDSCWNAQYTDIGNDSCHNPDTVTVGESCELREACGSCSGASDSTIYSNSCHGYKACFSIYKVVVKSNACNGYRACYGLKSQTVSSRRALTAEEDVEEEEDSPPTIRWLSPKTRVSGMGVARIANIFSKSFLDDVIMNYPLPTSPPSSMGMYANYAG